MENLQYKIAIFENNSVNEQILDASIFDTMTVTKCYCKLDSESYVEGKIKIN